MQMSYVSSEKAPCQPTKMNDCVKNGADSVDDQLTRAKKVDQGANMSVDSSKSSACKAVHKDPISKRKPNLTITPPYDSRRMDPAIKFVSDSNNYNQVSSPRMSPNSELPTTSTGGVKNTSIFSNFGHGSGSSSRSDSLESSPTPLRPHTGGDVRWDAINTVSKGFSLSLSHFRLLKRIGYGDIGSVYLVELKGTRAYFAMKVMDKASLVSRNKLLRAQTEREILGLLDHPFLPTLYSYFETDKYYCLVMEFCSGGNLHSLRQKQPNKYFTEEAAR